MSRNKVTVEIDLEAVMKEVSLASEEGIKAVAEEAKNRAKSSASFIDRSGKLRKSIKVERSKKRRKEGETVYLLRVSAPHAHLIERGHAMVTRNGEVVGHVPARPFLQPAADSVMAEAEQLMDAHLKKIDIKA